MKTSLIRQKFIDFFREKKHTIIPSVPIVQHNNPSLLFVNAGMNPFTNIFLGNEQPTHLRLANSQPCLRVTGKHNDLEEVGLDSYHHTLFEMLGNWSFGDYFKKEAIAYAWELLTNVYMIPKEKLYVTVFKGHREDNLDADEESYELWRGYLSEEHILYGEKKDNFWEMGATGPCGSSTEIHVDLRSEEEKKKVAGRLLLNKDHPEVVELWNLVFIQYHRKADGKLLFLPKYHVDTGMGLERVAMVLQGKKATYETDLFQPLIQNLAKIAQIHYGENPQQDIALRVGADHIRAITFAIAHGALPSNQKAGYVVRRLLRRAVRYGYQYLNLKRPFLHELVPTLIAQIGEAYPILIQQKEIILQRIYQEEENFLRTLKQGMRHFYHFRRETGGTTFSGKVAFQLYDTYGFPLDLTKLMAKEEGMEVDEVSFEKEMEIQKKRSQQVAEKLYGDWQKVGGREGKTTFIGYDELEASSQLIAYRKLVQKGITIYQLILDQTPFYPEGGGQVGDRGMLYSGEEAIPLIESRKEEGLHLHYTHRLPADLHAPIKAVVDSTKRQLTTNNHTATHLLEGALRKILGSHITQQGSYLNHERLRFDFTHPQKLTSSQCLAIEDLVNEKVRENIPCQEVRGISFEEAKKQGAITLVGEQYGEKVRMITFDPNFSIALCGGTHLSATGEIGFFKIITETSVATGIRRIEAITARRAEQWVQSREMERNKIKQKLKEPQDLLKAIENLQIAFRKEEKKNALFLKKERQQAQKNLKEQIKKGKNLSLGIARLEVSSIDELRKIMVSFNRDINNLILVIATSTPTDAYLAVMVSATLTPQYEAEKILKKLAPHIKGKGGGNQGFAIAKGDYLIGIQEALTHAHKLFNAS